MPPRTKRTKKHSIRTQLASSKNWIWKSKLIIDLANKTFHLLFALGEILQLHPIYKTSEGTYKVKTGVQLALHCCIIAVFVAIGVEKSWATLEAFECDHGDEFTKAACLTVVTVSVGCGIVASAVIIRPIETADLLNVSKINFNRIVNNVDAAIKILLVTWAYLAAAVTIGAASCVLDIFLPVQSYAFAIQIGLVGKYDKSGPLKIAFGIADFITIAAPPIIVATLTITILILGIARYKGLADELRLKLMDSLYQRSQLEQEYIAVDVHQSILSNWLKFMMPRALLIFALSALLNFYITFRMTQLPWFIHVVAPYCGMNEILAMFALAYDGVCAIRSAHDVRGRLQADHANCMEFMAKSMRVAVVKRAKALRPPGFPVGDFTDFSLQVPVKVSEEILNQLLLLLSF